MQGSGSPRDPRITAQLRLETLTKLVTDLVQDANPLDQRVTGRLRHSASRFETEIFATANSKEDYLRILSQRPVVAILPNGDYISTISGPALAAMSSNRAVSSLQNSRVGVFKDSQNGTPSGSGTQQASGNFFLRRNNYERQQARPTEVTSYLHGQPHNISEPLPTTAQQTVPNQLISLNTQNQFGQHINLSNVIYHQQHGSICNLHPLPQRQPHPGFLQPRRIYQRRQQQIKTAAKNFEAKISQPGAVATEQLMINQMVGSSSNQFRSYAFKNQDLVQKNNIQHMTNEALRISDSQQNQLSKNKGIQESQVVAKPGSKDCPFLLPEENSDWQDIGYRVLQRCKGECSPVILKVHRNFQRLHPQANSEDVKKMTLATEKMLNFINMQSSSLVHITKPSFYTQIEKIYKFSRGMRKKHPTMFSGPGEEPKSADPSEQQEVPPAVTEANHTLQQQDLLPQQGATSQGEHNTGVTIRTDAQPINALVVVSQSDNQNHEVIQYSQIGRVIAAANGGSTETLDSVTHDMVVVTDRRKSSANEDGRTINEISDKRFKWDVDALVVFNFYGIDSLIDLGQHTLNRATRTEVNKALMTEIEFLQRRLMETEVSIVEPEGVDNVFIVACTFRGRGSAASNDFSHLFPARMQLGIPREYPQSQPTILHCSHQRCGMLCRELERRRSIQLSDMTSVKETVLSWDTSAHKLYRDICSGFST